MELERLVMEMRYTKCETSEEDTCATMLQSLPALYEGLIQAFTMTAVQFRFSDLVSKLLAEEVRQNESSRIEETTAMFVNKKKNKRIATMQNEGRQEGFLGACFKCERIGHYARDCRSSGKASGWDSDQSNVAFNVSEGVTSENWIMDSGASEHMSKSGANLKVLGYETVGLRLWTGTKWINARLENTLHIQDLSKNLFSLTAATARTMTVKITRNECIVDCDGVPVATARKEGTLLYLNTEPGDDCHLVENESDLCHRRPEHASYGTINKIIKNGLTRGTGISSMNTCNVCAIAKQVRTTFNSTIEESEARESTRSDNIVCFDIMGPINPKSRSVYQYVVSFILMKSRYTLLYPLRKKSELPEVFKKFYNDLKTMTDIKVKILRSDNGGEYNYASMNAFCNKMHIKKEYTVPYNPEQNGMAERINRTLIEMSRCMLKDSSLSKSYWCEAMMTAVDIRNVLPDSSDLNSCPF
uniref:PREDICTED: similar to Copia protein (Gagintpol protein) putative n=1 Tax=Albugo laibachii Nc14 TaxID=890382 RepID=F0WZZ7_9STRA|nr:PREDICTED: similar to Copia protein (Gagintpol protein) putative [Albugo laibachii Nc14]|eukprot:CCA27078.1 PREDICTED: similar to Copia protein (Gagintpol protein) putative [Albugo laibachii Nc14]